jgi:hypothetical protein
MEFRGFSRAGPAEAAIVFVVTQLALDAVLDLVTPLPVI